MQNVQELAVAPLFADRPVLDQRDHAQDDERQEQGAENTDGDVGLGHSGRLGFDTEKPVEASRLRLERAESQALDLELPRIRRKLAPLGDTAGCDA